MFTGIIEDLGKIIHLEKDQGNLHLTIQSKLTPELKIDQSVSHNGVCLTVIEKKDDTYVVTAIKETLDKTNLDELQKGEIVNLERAMIVGSRLDGHIVQGHVDQIGTCTKITEENGSWRYSFSHDSSLGNITIDKGSITINGVSLTVIDSKKDGFSVAIIPYTYENTGFKSLSKGNNVNLEFDVVGKYVKRFTEHY